MPYCPTCHSEYRDEIVQCAHCEVALVDALPESGLERGEQLREAVKENKAAAIVRANYTEACQMVEALHAHGVDAMVSGDPDSCGKGGRCSHFFVVVLPEDVASANEVLREQWRKLLDESGVEAAAVAAVDFDSEGAHVCPACGTSFEGVAEECPECGLFLGAA
jgi:hypothetical protein